MNNTFGGIWLSVKSNDDYSRHNFIRFENEEIKYFNIDNQHKIELSLIESELSRESLNDCQYEFINADRIRFYKNGKIYNVYGNGKSITEDCVVEKDYLKLKPTITSLSEKEISDFDFTVNWGNEEFLISFNKILDDKVSQEINKRLGYEGRKIILEKLDKTLLVSVYSNGERENILPIIQVNHEEIVLGGFPREPFVIKGSRTN